jgi:predicted acylesterase/phospholipase RssA
MTENRTVRKIALILAGGVSLGSYEAGVLTELLYALETLNATAQQEERPRYVLDVMTGGSAGRINSSVGGTNYVVRSGRT